MHITILISFYKENGACNEECFSRQPNSNSYRSVVLRRSRMVGTTPLHAFSVQLGVSVEVTTFWSPICCYLILVGTKGLEPSTSRSRTVRSSQLSYVPIRVNPNMFRSIKARAHEWCATSISVIASDPGPNCLPLRSSVGAEGGATSRRA